MPTVRSVSNAPRSLPSESAQPPACSSRSSAPTPCAAETVCAWSPEASCECDKLALRSARTLAASQRIEVAAAPMSWPPSACASTRGFSRSSARVARLRARRGRLGHLRRTLLPVPGRRNLREGKGLQSLIVAQRGCYHRRCRGVLGLGGAPGQGRRRPQVAGRRLHPGCDCVCVCVRGVPPRCLHSLPHALWLSMRL